MISDPFPVADGEADIWELTPGDHLVAKAVQSGAVIPEIFSLGLITEGEV